MIDHSPETLEGLSSKGSARMTGTSRLTPKRFSATVYFASLAFPNSFSALPGLGHFPDWPFNGSTIFGRVAVAIGYCQRRPATPPRAKWEARTLTRTSDKSMSDLTSDHASVPPLSSAPLVGFTLIVESIRALLGARCTRMHSDKQPAQDHRQQARSLAHAIAFIWHDWQQTL